MSLEISLQKIGLQFIVTTNLGRGVVEEQLFIAKLCYWKYG